MINKWFTTVECNGVKADTMVDKTDLLEGETLTGKVYVTADSDVEKIDCIVLRVLKKSGDSTQIIGKSSVELVGSVHTKGMEFVEFEIVPDDRWACEDTDEIIFETIVVFTDGTEIKEEGVITYTFLEE
ncbi:MAG: cysteine synthase [Lysinibacillus sp.]